MDCSICIYRAVLPYMVLPCEHIVCSSCIEEWFRVRKSCRKCNKKYITNMEDKLFNAEMKTLINASLDSEILIENLYDKLGESLVLKLEAEITPHIDKLHL